MKTGPKYKRARRLGAPVFEKTQTQKYALREERRAKRTSGPRRRRSRSNFALQHKEKQKARYVYGLTERQFSRYVKEAFSHKDKRPTDALYSRLERRIDNIVYRLGLATTRRMARQLVSHGHITFNGRKVTVPSIEVVKGDVVGIREESKQKTVFASLEKQPPVSQWLSYDVKKQEGTVVGEPSYNPSDELFDLAAVLEFYSR